MGTISVYFFLFCFIFVIFFSFVFFYLFFMTQYYLTIFADLMEINPTNPVVIPDPFMTNRSLTSNVKMFYRLIRWSINTNDRVGTLVNAYYQGYLLYERVSKSVIM